MKGAHRAGTDVDGVVDILCDRRVTKKIKTNTSAIPLESWLEHSNHSKARLDWETKMRAEVEAENETSVQAGSIVVTGGGCTSDDDGEESDSSEECIAEEIVSHVGGNKSRKYIVRWQGYDAADTSEEPARRFGTELPFELLEKYVSAHPSAISGHPGHKGAFKHIKTAK